MPPPLSPPFLVQGRRIPGPGHPLPIPSRDLRQQVVELGLSLAYNPPPPPPPQSTYALRLKIKPLEAFGSPLSSWLRSWGHWACSYPGHVPLPGRRRGPARGGGGPVQEGSPVLGGAGGPEHPALDPGDELIGISPWAVCWCPTGQVGVLGFLRLWEEVGFAGLGCRRKAPEQRAPLECQCAFP